MGNYGAKIDEVGFAGFVRPRDANGAANQMSGNRLVLLQELAMQYAQILVRSDCGRHAVGALWSSCGKCHGFGPVNRHYISAGFDPLPRSAAACSFAAVQNMYVALQQWKRHVLFAGPQIPRPAGEASCKPFASVRSQRSSSPSSSDQPLLGRMST